MGSTLATKQYIQEGQLASELLRLAKQEVVARHRAFRSAHLENRQTKRCEENRSKIDHSWSEKQKRAIEWREVGNHVSRRDPREGVPVLYLILSLPQSGSSIYTAQ